MHIFRPHAQQNNSHILEWTCHQFSYQKFLQQKPIQYMRHLIRTYVNNNLTPFTLELFKSLLDSLSTLTLMIFLMTLESDKLFITFYLELLVFVTIRDLSFNSLV